MSDATEAVESLRALAAWLDQGSEPDPDDRPAIRARWDAIGKAAELLGDLAGWDDEVLREAAGTVQDDEEPWSGHGLLALAALRAEHQKEPLPITADRLAFSALLGAMVVTDEDAWAGWVTNLAGHHSSDPPAALALAQQVAPAKAWAEQRETQVQLAQELLAEAEAACRRSGR